MTTSNNDEIDLKLLLKKIFVFIKSYKILWLVSFVTAIIAGIYGYSTTKIFYETKMIITSNLVAEIRQDRNIIDLQPILSVLANVEEQINKHNKDFITKDLQIATPEEIKSINISVFKDKNLTRVSPKNIQIKIQVYDTNILDTLQKNIITYCNSNNYIQEQIKKQQQFRKQTIKTIDKRLNFFNFMQEQLQNDIEKHNQLLLINFNDWQSILDLEIQKTQMSNITDTTAVSIIVPFSKYPTPISKKSQKAIIYFLIVIILGIFLAITLEILKILKNE